MDLIEGGLQMPFEILQSTVGTTTSAQGPNWGFQRKTFYAAGRYWVFYCSAGGTIVYRTSSNGGSSWSNATTVISGATAGSVGPTFSVYFDGTFLHYAFCDNNWGTSTVIVYRRGTPNSDGTITWSAVQQTAVAAVSGYYHYKPCISVDSTGHAWIGYDSYAPGTGYEYPYVSRNNNTDGTWNTTSGFPYLLENSASMSSVCVTPVALANSRVLCIYARASATVKAKLYNAGWGAQETATSSSSYIGESHCAVADANENVEMVVHLVTSYNIVHVKRTYSTGLWSAETSVKAAAGQYGLPALSIDRDTGNLWCFWLGTTAKHVYFKRRMNGSWDASDTDWITEANAITANYDLNCFYQKWNGSIVLIYESESSSPYNIRFALISLNVSKTFATDALMQKLDIPSTFGMDMWVALRATLDFGTDAILVNVAGIPYAIDVLLKKLSIETGFGIDVLLKYPVVRFAVDLLLKKLGIPAAYAMDLILLYYGTKQFGSDVILKKKSIPATFGIDTRIVRQFKKYFNSDLILKKLFAQSPFAVDLLLKKLGLPRTFAVDAIIKAIRESQLGIDLFLKKKGAAAAFGIDTVLEAAFLEDFSLDVCLKKLGIPSTFAVDAILVARFESSLAIDAILKAVLSSRFNIDSLLKKCSIPLTIGIDLLLDTVPWHPYLPTIIIEIQDYCISIIAEQYSQTVEIESYSQDIQEMPDRAEWSR